MNSDKSPVGAENQSVEELRQAVELHKEQIAKWSGLVKEFGEKLGAQEREHGARAVDESRLQKEVTAKKNKLQEEKAKVAKVEDEIKIAKEKATAVILERMEMEEQSNTLKNVVNNLIVAEKSMDTHARAKEEALSNEFQPLLSKQAAQEKMLNEEIILMRQEVEQHKEHVESLKSKEESTNIEIRRHKELLSESEAKLRDLRQEHKAKQEEFDRRRTDLSNEVSKKEKQLQDSEVEMREKVLAYDELNKEFEKVDKDVNDCQKNVESTNKEIHNEREQIRSLKMNIQDVESRRQTEAVKLANLKKDLEEADKEFKRKSKELSDLTEQEQQNSISYVEDLERELGLLKSTDEDVKKMGKSPRNKDPEFERLRNEIEQKQVEISNVKREHEKEAEEARMKHFQRKAEIEVANARMSSEQRLFHLNEMYSKEKAELNRKKTNHELQLSEGTKTLAALKADLSTHLNQFAPEVWKLRETTEDDEKFEEKLNKEVIFSRKSNTLQKLLV